MASPDRRLALANLNPSRTESQSTLFRRSFLDLSDQYQALRALQGY